MVISHSLRYVYLAVPKTASTSVARVLLEEFEGERHGGFHNVVMPDHCADYYKFCTVRHPYTRARSLFFHARRISRHRCHEVALGTFGDYMRWMADPSREPSVFVNNADYDENRSSGKVEREFYHESVNKRLGRDLNQVDYISYFFGINYVEKMDYIIRMEDIENRFAQLPFVNKQVVLPNLNTSKNKWDVTMDDKTKDLIYQWAKDDFVAFNYGR